MEDKDWNEGEQKLPTTADYFELQKQHDQLQSELFNTRQQNASLFSQLEAVKRVANDKQLEVDHCRNTCGELRDLLTKANNECDRLRSLAVAAADLSIDVAQQGIDASKRIEELEHQLANTEANVMEREADLILAAPEDELKEGGQRWTPGQVTVARMIGTMMKTRAALARAKAGV